MKKIIYSKHEQQHTHTDRRSTQQQQQDDGVELENERRHKTEDYI